MSDEQPRVGEQRPGGRAARVRTAVLHAASDLLAEVGYENMSMEEVATLAGVHKTTVYRRWPTKAELVFDVISLQAEANVAVPNTGTLHGDLKALARSVITNLNAANGAGRAQGRMLVAAAASSDEVARSMHRFWVNRFAATEKIVQHAIARSEVAPETDPSLIIEALVGPIWLRVLMTGEPLSVGYADQVAALVASAATH